MEYHGLIEALGILVPGALFYSHAYGRIVRIESTPPTGSTPPILDTEKSSRPADE